MTDNLPVRAASNELAMSDTANPVEVYLQTLGSADSRRTMSRSLDRLAELLTGEPTPATAIPWHELRPDRTTYLKSALLEMYAVSTVRKMLSALSGVLRECWRLGLMDESDYRTAIAWGRVRGSGLRGAQAGRHVEKGELRALFEVCADSPHHSTGARDAALIAVLFGGGVRRAEAVALDLEHYDRDVGELVVHGKGNKIRKTYLTGGARDALAAWIDIRGDWDGPLFIAINKAGRLDPYLRRMTTQAVYGILQRKATAAKVRRFSPHDLRRTFAGELFDAGADTAAVQQLMGHASSATTTSYDRRGERAKVRAAGLLHVPYVQPHILEAPLLPAHDVVE